VLRCDKKMPGLDGTGPCVGGPMTGWRRGRCNPVSQKESAIDSVEEAGQATVQEAGGAPSPVYGLGRGGIPCGCGRGYSGGMRGGRGSPRGGGMRGRF